MQNMSSFAFLLVTICAVVFLLPTKMATSRTNCNLTVRNVTFQANSTLRTFNSPSYPRAYPVSITCTYLFTAPEGHRIELIFSNFHLEGNSPKCTNDYLEVRDGPTGKSTLLNRLCGAETPKPIISSANDIHLFFVSNDQFMFEGFSGTYRTVGEDVIAECTKETPSAYLFSSGYITTPEHPSKYPPSRECSWTLQAPPRHFMRVTFNTFQTQCPSDKVVVRDRDQNGQLLGEFCGENKPPVFHGAKLWVRFTSDAIVTTAEEGFNVTYEMLPFVGYISDHCTGGSNKIINVNESSPGIIKSPWSPDFYPNNLNCVWRIRAREGRRIKLTITSLDLESPCNSDYVEVRDTSVGSTSPRGKFCAGFSSIVSASEEVMVQFVTGPNGRRKGFEIKYAVNAAFHVAQPPGGLLYLFAMLMIPVYYGVR